MFWPSLVDYNDAIQSPAVNLRDPELAEAEVATDPLGLPAVASGNFASVYRLNRGEESWAVKCFFRNIPERHDRYRKISEAVQQTNVPYLIPCDYQPEGIYIASQWFPILRMPWVEGLHLNQFVAQHLGRPDVLTNVARAWVSMLRGLRATSIAHGDLQHGNVLIVANRLRLVDYDGMYVPALEGATSIEEGHPEYQHPRRGGAFGPDLDRFSALVVYTALRALAYEPELWDAHDQGENLLFRCADYKGPSESKLFQDLLQLPHEEVRVLSHRVLAACQGDLDDTPDLLDVAKPGGVSVPDRRSPTVLPAWLDQVSSRRAPEPPPVVMLQAAPSAPDTREPTPPEAPEPPVAPAEAPPAPVEAGSEPAEVVPLSPADSEERPEAIPLPPEATGELRALASLLSQAKKAAWRARWGWPVGGGVALATWACASFVGARVFGSFVDSPEERLVACAITVMAPLLVSLLILRGCKTRIRRAKNEAPELETQATRDAAAFAAAYPDLVREVFASNPGLLLDRKAVSLALAQAKSQPPVLSVLTPDLDLGDVAPGGRRRQKLRLANGGGGKLTGTVAVESEADWLRLGGRRESRAIRGNSIACTIVAHGALMTPDEVSRASVHVITNGGQSEVRVCARGVSALEGPLRKHRGVIVSLACLILVAATLFVVVLKVNPFKWQEKAVQAVQGLFHAGSDSADAKLEREARRLLRDAGEHSEGWEWDEATGCLEKLEREYGATKFYSEHEAQIAEVLATVKRWSAFKVPSETTDQYGNPVVEREGRRDPGTRCPYEIWLDDPRIELVLIPKGRTTKPFYLAKYELTQRQWERLMQSKPWESEAWAQKGDRYPALSISWQDCQACVKKLNDERGLCLRLPTQAEWECACRAGATTRFCFGDDAYRLDDYAWFRDNAWSVDGERYAHPVGRKRPNAWGLYDMHGNVSEWCQDRFARGGNFRDQSLQCRSASGKRESPNARSDGLGVRLAASSP